MGHYAVLFLNFTFNFIFVVKNHMVLVSVNCAQLLTLILRRTFACTPKAYCTHYSIVRMILSYINPVEKFKWKTRSRSSGVGVPESESRSRSPGV